MNTKNSKTRWLVHYAFLEIVCFDSEPSLNDQRGEKEHAEYGERRYIDVLSCMSPYQLFALAQQERSEREKLKLYTRLILHRLIFFRFASSHQSFQRRHHSMLIGSRTFTVYQLSREYWFLIEQISKSKSIVSSKSISADNMMIGLDKDADYPSMFEQLPQELVWEIIGKVPESVLQLRLVCVLLMINASLERR